MIRSALRRLALPALLASLVVPATAEAKPNLLSIMMDDDLLLYRDDATRDARCIRMSELGVDQRPRHRPVERRRTRRPQDQGAGQALPQAEAPHPKAYPELNWDRYDRLVRAARRLGISVYFNVTGPGPAWGHAKAPASQKRNRATWKPKPKEFDKFVQAVGKRYSGRFRDENDERVILPKVGVWSIWNEPNQAGWLLAAVRRQRPPRLAAPLPRALRPRLPRAGLHGPRAAT